MIQNRIDRSPKSFLDEEKGGMQDSDYYTCLASYISLQVSERIEQILPFLMLDSLRSLQ